MIQLEEIKSLKSKIENDPASLNSIKQEFLKQQDALKVQKELERKLNSEYEALLQIGLHQNAEFQLKENSEISEENAYIGKKIVEGEQFSNDYIQKLETTSCLLGYRITNQSIDKNTQLITLHYNEHFFVQFKKGEPFDLLKINPEHPNFDAIKAMLHETYDICGLLAILRKYFDFIAKSSK